MEREKRESATAISTVTQRADLVSQFLPLFSSPLSPFFLLFHLLVLLFLPHCQPTHLVTAITVYTVLGGISRTKSEFMQIDSPYFRVWS